MKQTQLEHRMFSGLAPRVERRKTEEGGEVTVISGYAAVYYQDDDPATEYRMYTDAVERIAAGAFDAVLKSAPDVRALVNHNPDRLLGRTAAGTLELEADKTGLRYEITPPDTAEARDTIALIERGDLSGASFAFTVKKEEWKEGDSEENEPDIRTIKEVGELFDVGPVTYPAYEGTSTGLRSEHDQELALSRERWRMRVIVAEEEQKERKRKWRYAKAAAKIADLRRAG